MSRESVEEKFRILMSLMRSAHHRDGGRFADPSRGQGRIIALLKLHDGVSTKQLSSILDVRISSLNETLAKLEAAGLIERRPSEQDGRIMLSYLTDAGRAAAPDEAQRIDPLADFSDDDFATLDALLARMIANVEQSVGADAVRAEQERAAERRGMIDAFQRGEWDGAGENGPRSGRGARPGKGGPRRGPHGGHHRGGYAERGPRDAGQRGGKGRHRGPDGENG